MPSKMMTFPADSAELPSVLGSRAGQGGVGQVGFDTGPDPPQGLASELDRADGAPQVLAADDSASAEIYECEDRQERGLSWCCAMTP